MEQKEQDRMQVRLPTDLKGWLKEKAKSESRSMNSQLIRFLEGIRQEESQAA